MLGGQQWIADVVPPPKFCCVVDLRCCLPTTSVTGVQQSTRYCAALGVREVNFLRIFYLAGGWWGRWLRKYSAFELKLECTPRSENLHYGCRLHSVATLCKAPHRERTSKALRYGTRSQRISQFYLHTPRTSANGINHICLCLSSRSWYLFTDPGGMIAELASGLRTLNLKTFKIFYEFRFSILVQHENYTLLEVDAVRSTTCIRQFGSMNLWIFPKFNRRKIESLSTLRYLSVNSPN